MSPYLLNNALCVSEIDLMELKKTVAGGSALMVFFKQLNAFVG